jgi:hypothetical protein
VCNRVQGHVISVILISLADLQYFLISRVTSLSREVYGLCIHNKRGSSVFNSAPTSISCKAESNVYCEENCFPYLRVGRVSE